MSGERALVHATVVGVNDSSVLYPCCLRCYAKMYCDLRSYLWECLHCNSFCETSQLTWRYRLSLNVADSCASCHLSLFGGTLVPHFGCSANEFQRFVSSTIVQGQPLQRELILWALEMALVGNSYLFGLKMPVTQVSVNKPQKQQHHCGKNSCLVDFLQRLPSAQDGKLPSIISLQMIHTSGQSSSKPSNLSSLTVIEILQELVKDVKNRAADCSRLSKNNKSPFLLNVTGCAQNHSIKKSSSKRHTPMSTRKSLNADAKHTHVKTHLQDGHLNRSYSSFSQHSKSCITDSQDSDKSQNATMFTCDSSMERYFPVLVCATDSRTRVTSILKNRSNHNTVNISRGSLSSADLLGNLSRVFDSTHTHMSTSITSPSIKCSISASNNYLCEIIQNSLSCLTQQTPNVNKINQDTISCLTPQTPDVTEINQDNLSCFTPQTPDMREINQNSLSYLTPQTPDMREINQNNLSYLTPQTPDVREINQDSLSCLTPHTPDMSEINHDSLFYLTPQTPDLCYATNDNSCEVLVVEKTDIQCDNSKANFLAVKESKDDSVSDLLSSLNASLKGKETLSGVSGLDCFDINHFDQQKHPTKEQIMGMTHQLTCDNLMASCISETKLDLNSMYNSHQLVSNCRNNDLNLDDIGTASCDTLQVGKLYKADNSDMPDSEDLSLFLNAAALETAAAITTTNENHSHESAISSFKHQSHQLSNACANITQYKEQRSNSAQKCAAMTTKERDVFHQISYTHKSNAKISVEDSLIFKKTESVKESLPWRVYSLKQKTINNVDYGLRTHTVSSDDNKFSDVSDDNKLSDVSDNYKLSDVFDPALLPLLQPSQGNACLTAGSHHSLKDVVVVEGCHYISHNDTHVEGKQQTSPDDTISVHYCQPSHVDALQSDGIQQVSEFDTSVLNGYQYKHLSKIPESEGNYCQFLKIGAVELQSSQNTPKSKLSHNHISAFPHYELNSQKPSYSRHSFAPHCSSKELHPHTQTYAEDSSTSIQCSNQNAKLLEVLGIPLHKSSLICKNSEVHSTCQNPNWHTKLSAVDYEPNEQTRQTTNTSSNSCKLQPKTLFQTPQVTHMHSCSDASGFLDGSKELFLSQTPPPTSLGKQNENDVFQYGVSCEMGNDGAFSCVSSSEMENNISFSDASAYQILESSFTQKRIVPEQFSNLPEKDSKKREQSTPDMSSLKRVRFSRKSSVLKSCGLSRSDVSSREKMLEQQTSADTPLRSCLKKPLSEGAMPESTFPGTDSRTYPHLPDLAAPVTLQSQLPLVSITPFAKSSGQLSDFHVSGSQDLFSPLSNQSMLCNSDHYSSFTNRISPNISYVASSHLFALNKSSRILSPAADFKQKNAQRVQRWATSTPSKQTNTARVLESEPQFFISRSLMKSERKKVEKQLPCTYYSKICLGLANKHQARNAGRAIPSHHGLVGLRFGMRDSYKRLLSTVKKTSQQMHCFSPKSFDNSANLFDDSDKAENLPSYQEAHDTSLLQSELDKCDTEIKESINSLEIGSSSEEDTLSTSLRCTHLEESQENLDTFMLTPDLFSS